MIVASTLRRPRGNLRLPARYPHVLHLRNDLAPPADLLTGAALFLDFDGTLVELAPRPDEVHVGARLARLMIALAAKLDGRIAIISGRPAAEIAALFGGATFAIAGSHGMELHHADGRRVVADRPPALDAVSAEFTAFAARDAGLLVETKPLGVALHYRGAPAHGPDADALARRLADAHALLLQPGKMMAEVRSPAGDKGRALEALCREPHMASARPLFVGDDETDEPAFAAAKRHGGYGILVGQARDTSATHRLPNVAATLDWLEAAAA
jgi:trehalose 6-phosphate phosphatase